MIEIQIIILISLSLLDVFLILKYIYLKNYIVGLELKIKQLWASIDEIQKGAELENKILWEAMETTFNHLDEEIDKIKSVRGE
jgi:hypothetical protein